MASILEVQNLNKKYGDFTAVNGISFNIKEGEIFSLLGPNGAGKTTTISMLSTLYIPTSGDATIAGHSVTKDPNKQGMTVLYTTHYMEEAEELSNRVGIIDHGEMIAIGTQKELTQQVGQSETLILRVNENDDHARLVSALKEIKTVDGVSAV